MYQSKEKNTEGAFTAMGVAGNMERKKRPGSSFKRNRAFTKSLPSLNYFSIPSGSQKNVALRLRLSLTSQGITHNPGQANRGKQERGGFWDGLIHKTITPIRRPNCLNM